MSTARETDEDDQFRIPEDIVRDAIRKSREGVKITVTPLELIRLMKAADHALNGDSNDDEHDALIELRDCLSDFYEDPKRKT